MKKIIFLILVAVFVSTAYGVRNHNAVLICGDTPDLASLGGIENLPDEEIKKRVAWNGGEHSSVYDEFWNDSYLMWELLWDNTRYKLYGDTRPTDHIHVLYGEGVDYPLNVNPRYEASRHLDWNDPDGEITDYSANYADVHNIFTWLSTWDGNPPGTEPMGPDDELFCWTFDHGEYTSCLRIVDISNPDSPIEVGHHYLPSFTPHIYVLGNYAYVADGPWGMVILDISNPESPVKIENFNTPGFITDVFVRGNTAYTIETCFEGGWGTVCTLRVVNVQDPENPWEMGKVGVNWALGLDVEDRFATIADGNGAIFVNVGLLPPVVSGWYYWFEISESWDVDAVGSYAYVAEGACGLRIDQIQPPDGVGEYNTPGWAYDVHVDGNYAYIADEESGLQIINISEPTAPELAGSLDTPGLARNVYISGSYAYVADCDSGLRIIDITDPSSPLEKTPYFPPDQRSVQDVYVSGDYAYILTEGRDEIVHLCLMDWPILDSTFAEYVNKISCAKQTFWMQQCFSGGFVDDLESPNAVILTACDYNESAWRADDLPWDSIDAWQSDPDPVFNWLYYRVRGSENDTVTIDDILNTFDHGEYNFHVMNAVRGEELLPYTDPRKINSDTNFDLLVSMEETFNYLEKCDSWQYLHGIKTGLFTFYYGPETPQYSDLGTIGANTFLGWDDGFTPDAPTNLDAWIDEWCPYPTRCIVKLTWDGISEPEDFAGYEVYMRKSGQEEYDHLKGTTSTSYSFTLYPKPGKKYYFYVTSMDITGNESGPSNVVWILPLDYESEAGAKTLSIGMPIPSMYLVHRDGFRHYGDFPDYYLYPEFATDYSEDTLVYHFDSLDTEKRYRIAITFYADSSENPRTQSVSIDGFPIIIGYPLPSCKPEIFVRWVPKAAYLDGEITLKIARVNGDNVVMSEFILMEYVTGGGGGPMSASTHHFLPKTYYLFQNYPNPCVSSTTIRYHLPKESKVSLKIYNQAGQLVRTLVNGTKKAGVYTAQWDGKDKHESNLPCGIYFYRLETGDFTSTKKIVLIR